MHEFALWCGFLGSWLLVAGPVYQSVLELEAEQFEVDRIRSAVQTVARPPETSAWWWLLPPAHVLIERHRRSQYRAQVADAMTDEDFEAFGAYLNKATSWMFVSGGALLIAVKETYELVEHSGWPIAVFWVLLVVMAAACVANTWLRQRADGEARRRRARRAAG